MTRSPLYYPTFEIENSDWLKFALLYFENLEPIIPESANHLRSDLSKRLEYEVGFIKPFSPDKQDTWRSSKDAVDSLNRILQDPKNYSCNRDDLERIANWRNPKYFDRLLFAEKFTVEFKSFLIEEGLAKEVSQGVVLSRDVADLYMSIFAHVVSEAKGMEPVTDHPWMDRYASLSRKTGNEFDITTGIAQSVIELSIPKDLSNVSFESIIELRNQDGFLDRLQAFRRATSKYYTNLEMGNASEDFVRSQRNLIKDLSDDMVSRFFNSIPLTMTTWLAVHKSNLGFAELAASGAFVVDSYINIRNSWKSTSDRRLTRKHLATISNLQA